MIEWLKGKKTYTLSALAVLASLVQFFTGDITLIEFVSGPHLILLLNGLGLGALRAGVSKVTKNGV